MEKRADAQLAREIEVALPREFTREQQKECVRYYIQDNFVSKGMCVDWALHDKGDGNPHAHIMLTVRAFDDKGKWIAKQKTSFAYDENGQKIPIVDETTGEQKVRIREGKGTEKMWVRISVPSNDWNDHSKAEEWREAWATECNKLLPADIQLDHRSYEKQGIEKIATIHEGFVARDIEKNGGTSTKCELNREIKKYNSIYENVRALAVEFTQSIIEKARIIINGFNEFRRSSANVGNTRENADNLRRTTDGSRAVEMMNSRLKESLEETTQLEKALNKENQILRLQKKKLVEQNQILKTQIESLKNLKG